MENYRVPMKSFSMLHRVAPCCQPHSSQLLIVQVPDSDCEVASRPACADSGMPPGFRVFQKLGIRPTGPLQTCLLLSY